MALILTIILCLFAIKCAIAYIWREEDAPPPERPEPAPQGRRIPEVSTRLIDAFWDWHWELRENDAPVIPKHFGARGAKVFLSDGRILIGRFVWKVDGCKRKIVGFRCTDGTLFTGDKAIPVDAHIKAFVGALSQPGMSSALDGLIFELAEKGEVVADITKLNGISIERYQAEYFREDMRKAWGDALIQVLEGACNKFTVDNEKPWLITLYAPKEPKLA